MSQKQKPTKHRPNWHAYVKVFADTITKRKGLKRPYWPTGHELKLLAEVYDQFGPEDVLGCWALAQESGQLWSTFGAQCGRSIKWFCNGHTIMTIMDDKRWRTKADQVRREWGTDAASVMAEIKAEFINREVK